MAVEFLDKLGLQRLWTKIKNTFLAKDASGNVNVAGNLSVDNEVTVTDTSTFKADVYVKEGSRILLHNQDDSKSVALSCSNDGKVAMGNAVLATVSDVNTAVLGLASEDFVNTAVANAAHLKREKVTTLPGVATAKENVIYMLPISGASGDDTFDEYMLIDGKLEKMGSSRVDLSGYPTTEQMNTAIFNAHTRITDEEIDALS